MSTLAGGSSIPPPDLILWNGKIFTSNLTNPYAEAIAIRGDRIVAVGESDPIRDLAGPPTAQVDLGGRTVIPGINDAHMHFDIVPRDSVELDFGSLNPTWETVSRSVSAAVAKAGRGAILLGDIGPSTFCDLRANRESLDLLSENHPIILTVLTGHAAILNSVALSRFGFRKEDPDPLGGRLERSADDRLSGVLREYAVFELMRRIGDSTSDSEAVPRLRARLAKAAEFGITSIQNMSNAMTPERCLALLEQVPTPIRVRVIRMPMTGPRGRDVEEGRPPQRGRLPLVTQDGTKWVLDGTPVEGTFEPRLARGERFANALSVGPSQLEELAWGFPATFPEDEIPVILEESLADEDPLMLHLSGRPTAASVVAAMEASGGAQTWASKRVRFEHGDGLSPELLSRVAKLGVVVVQNPGHFSGLSSSTGLIMQSVQPLRSLLVANIPVALGSDGPMNPFLNIMLATTHPNHPSEAVSREQAVVAYTHTSAYAEFAEGEKGSLEPGKLADVSVLSQDIFSVPTQQLPRTVSVLTIVGGRVVHNSAFDGLSLPVTGAKGA